VSNSQPIPNSKDAIAAVQLAMDQAAVYANRTKIRYGEQVLGQTGSYTQQVEFLGSDTQSLLSRLTMNSLILDTIDYELTFSDCQIATACLGFRDFAYQSSYWGAVAFACSFDTLHLYINLNNVDGLLWIDLGSGATIITLEGAAYGDYNFSLHLEDNAILAGTDADDGTSGTVCGIINSCYNNFYLGGASHSGLYLTGENMGQLEAGVHDGTIANADEMALAGWTVDYEVYIE